MKHILYIIILSTLLFSYKYENNNQKESGSRTEIVKSLYSKRQTKLDSLMSLPHDSVMEYFDLSNDSIKVFPDLSGYAIKSLDISFNQIDSFISAHLPRMIEKLTISHNQLKGAFGIKENAPYLKEIDISFNYIKKLHISKPLQRIIASHNDIRRIDMDHHNMQFLDISFNPRFNNRVTFDFTQVDTIIRKGIANDRPLYNMWTPPVGRIIAPNRIGQTSLESALEQIKASVTMHYYLEESGNSHPIYVTDKEEYSTRTKEPSAYSEQPQSSTALTTFFGPVNSIIKHMHEDLVVFVVVLPETKTDSRQYEYIKYNKNEIDTLSETLLNRIKKDLYLSTNNKGESHSNVADLSSRLTHYPREQAKKLFNADSMISYPIDLKGNVYQKKYTVCRAVAVTKNGLSFIMYFMMTKDRCKYFDIIYLPDFKKVFRFYEHKDERMSEKELLDWIYNE